MADPNAKCRTVATPATPATNVAFQETRWSLVLKACAGSREALEHLARTYWPAIYAFLRRKGFSPEEAKDLTQETLIRLLKEGQLPPVASSNGKFRSFLCACANHEASRARERNAAEKRGGNRLVSFELLQAEQNYQFLPVIEGPTERVFDRTWSQLMVGRALDKLRSEYARLGKESLCEALIPSLHNRTEQGNSRTLAHKLGLTENHAKVALSRFRRDFATHLRREVAETLADPHDLAGELQHLLSAWFSEPT